MEPDTIPNEPATAGEPIILLRAFCFTIASEWTEHLCLVDLGGGHWTLGEYTYEFFTDFVGLCDEECEPIIDEETDEPLLPEFIDEYRVLGRNEDGYVQIDKLNCNRVSEPFTREQLEVPVAFATANGWSALEDFSAAMERLRRLVDPEDAPPPEA